LDFYGYDNLMGRKPKPPSEKKSDVLRILLTKRDRASLDKAARRMNLDTSTWARMVLLQIVAESK
jgi:hypothetical protein